MLGAVEHVGGGAVDGRDARLRRRVGLRARVHALGGRIERREITTLDDALRECPRVINCAGLGARELAGDRLLHPVRGQVVRVENPGLTRVWIDEHSGPAITYIVPRSRDVVLGGSSEPNAEDRTPDPALTRAIIDRCAVLEPRLADARVLSVAVGLRPARTPLRLAAEPRDGGLVIHNYGHGGAGVTLSWGCAEAVLDLLAPEGTPRPGLGGEPPPVPPRTGWLRRS